MKKLHLTLKPMFNVMLMMVWGIGTMVGYFAVSPHPLLFIFVGAVLGLIGGLMQIQSFKEGIELFLNAETLLDVRSQLKSTKWGKRYLYWLWGGSILLAVFVVKLSPDPIVAFLAGYFSMMFLREVVTLKSAFELRKLLEEATNNE